MTSSTTSSSKPLGIDVSKYQGNVNWATVSVSGVCFALARVSDGIQSVDPYFSQNWTGIKGAGLLRGAYQFFRPTQDARAQADLFVSKVVHLTEGDLPPVIDVETDNGASSGAIIDAISRWQEVVEGALRREIIIYTSRSFWEDKVKNSTVFSNRPLWIAHYTNSSSPAIPSAWSIWTMWQYSQSGSVNGISCPVDQNKFNGSYDRLRALAGYS